MTVPTDRKPSDKARVLANPKGYADDAWLHDSLAWLRANEPVAWVDGILQGRRTFRPFWAVTKHADIMAIERDNELCITATSARSAPTGSGRRPCATSRCASTNSPNATSTGCARSGPNATSSPTS